MARSSSGHFYKVRRYKGHHELVISDINTFDSVVEGIRDACKRAAEQGYHNDEKWQIVLVKWESVYDDDGVFCSSWRKENAIALYDNGNVIEY